MGRSDEGVPTFTCDRGPCPASGEGREIAMRFRMRADDPWAPPVAWVRVDRRRVLCPPCGEMYATFMDALSSIEEIFWLGAELGNLFELPGLYPETEVTEEMRHNLDDCEESLAAWVDSGEVTCLGRTPYDASVVLAGLTQTRAQLGRVMAQAADRRAKLALLTAAADGEAINLVASSADDSTYRVKDGETYATVTIEKGTAMERALDLLALLGDS